MSDPMGVDFSISISSVGQSAITTAHAASLDASMRMLTTACRSLVDQERTAGRPMQIGCVRRDPIIFNGTFGFLWVCMRE